MYESSKTAAHLVLEDDECKLERRLLEDDFLHGADLQENTAYMIHGNIPRKILVNCGGRCNPKCLWTGLTIRLKYST